MYSPPPTLLHVGEMAQSQYLLCSRLHGAAANLRSHGKLPANHAFLFGRAMTDRKLKSRQTEMSKQRTRREDFAYPVPSCPTTLCFQLRTTAQSVETSNGCQ